MPIHKTKQAVGISIEGRAIHAVKMIWKSGQCEITAVKSFILPESEEKPRSTGNFENMEISHLDEVLNLNDAETISDDVIETNDDVFTQLIELTEHGKFPLAVAVSEPQIYYNIFDNNWGLSGRRLIKKLIAESGISRTSSNIDSESTKLLQMKEGKVVAISQEKHLPIYYQLETVAREMSLKAPKIMLVDGVELSLINLIHEYQCPLDGSITILVHITAQTSRFIFLQGKEILHFSHLISEGSDSADLGLKLYNRLQFELDNGNIKKIDTIIISGLERGTGVRQQFEESFGTRIVKPFKLHSINTLGINYSDREYLAPYAPAIGVACRLIDERMKCLFEVDLTPTHIRDMQNKLSLSPLGWALLTMIPLLIVGILFQIQRLNWELRQFQTQLIPKQLQMSTSIELEKKIEAAGQMLTMFEKTGVFLDSLKSGSKSYGEYLGTLMKTSQNYKGTWFTDVATGAESNMQMVGYSLDRNIIPSFATDIGAEIKMVEAQEIREHPVYRFELNTMAVIQQ